MINCPDFEARRKGPALCRFALSAAHPAHETICCRYLSVKMYRICRPLETFIKWAPHDLAK
jgi:hypothetical protein